ncbi:MAG: hypothetical protein K2Q10_06540, partial [Rhodospirillales bacterium]|nr:hypothetical protein [Rhodospirillales bacterium]
MSRLVFLPLWLAMALHFAWTRHHLSVQYAPGTLEALIAGTAATPFQYRALVPWLAAGLARLTEWGPGPLFFLLDAVSCLGLLAALFALTRPLLGDGTARGGLALLAWLALPSLFLLNPEDNFRYPYDLPSIIVFALGLMLLRAGRLWAFLILLVLGTLNRETTLFLIPAFLATHRDRLPRGRLILHAGLQLAAWAAVKAGLALLYAGNAGPGAMSWRSGDYTQTE